VRTSFLALLRRVYKPTRSQCGLRAPGPCNGRRRLQVPAYYDNWREEEFACGNCEWRGPGKDLVHGETFADFFEVDCPKCGGRISTVTFPTVDESRRNWDKVSPADKLVVEITEARLEDFDRRMLRSPDQLPDLTGDDLILAWDFDDDDTVLKYGDVVLWREPAFYEGYKRFEEVAEVLASKFGSRLQDLVPTPGSELFLYGDRIGAPYRIEKFREHLRERRNAVQSNASA